MQPAFTGLIIGLVALILVVSFIVVQFKGPQNCGTLETLRSPVANSRGILGEYETKLDALFSRQPPYNGMA